MKDKFKSNKPIVIISVILLIMSLTLISLAFFTPFISLGDIFSLTGSANYDVKPDFTYTELSEGITLNDSYPMKDEVGMKTTPYSFKITNNEIDYTISYNIIMETMSTNTLSNDLVSTSLGGILTTKRAVTPVNTGYSNAYIIKVGFLAPGESITHDLRVWINENGTVSNAQNKKWVGKIVVTADFGNPSESGYTLASLGLKSKNGSPNFSNMASTDEGIYSMDDDYGTSYYFRGAVENNYVKFAGFYWRILRINGDGSLRIIYDGTKAHSNSEVYGSATSDRYLGNHNTNTVGGYVSKYFNTSISNAGVGYMYGLGNTGNSGCYVNGKLDRSITNSSMCNGSCFINGEYDSSITSQKECKNGDVGVCLVDGKVDDSFSSVSSCHDGACYVDGEYVGDIISLNCAPKGTCEIGYEDMTDETTKYITKNNITKQECQNLKYSYEIVRNYSWTQTSATVEKIYGEWIYGTWKSGEWKLIDNAILNSNRCLKLVDGVVTDVISDYPDEGTCESAGGKWTTTAYDATHANIKDSYAKSYIDNWYSKNIKDTNFEQYISDMIFCNDRSISSGPGVDNQYTEYSAYNRLYINNNPQLKCMQKNDAFTVDDAKGNGDLTYPVGLITADELVLSGAIYFQENSLSVNNNGYFNKDYYYWTMTPKRFRSDAKIVDPEVFLMTIYGELYYNYPKNSVAGIAPVINLSKEYVRQMIGNGTIGNEFRVVE